MRTHLLALGLALGLVAGCTHKAHPAHRTHPASPAAPAPAAGAAPAGASAPAGTAAATGSALPAKVALILMDLGSYPSGRADYHATYGDKRLDAHFAQSRAGLAHAWNSKFTKGAYRDKHDTYRLKDGKCAPTSGTIGAMTMAMTTALPLRYGNDPLLMLTAAVPGSALKKTGTDRVAGVSGTTYRFDTDESLGIAVGHITGTVTLDADHHPLASKGTVTAHGAGTKDLAPVKWTFATKDLGGEVKVALPAACAAAKAKLAALAAMPVPPGAMKQTTLAGMTSYPVKAKSKAVAAFFKKALPDHGWKVDRTTAMGLSAHHGKTRVGITLLPQGATTLVMIRPE